MTTIGGWLAAHADLPRLDLDVLLGSVLNLSRAQVIAYPERQIPAEAMVVLETHIARLRSGEPLAYLLGEREFFSLPFSVSSSVLIPRPDTELLVDSAIARLEPGMRVLDLGTGSGIIAVCLARAGQCSVTATDISPDALAIARDNAQALNAEVEFLQSRWLDGITGEFDMIVSNPPYVAESDPHLAALQFEPLRALTAGPDGLNDLREIIGSATPHLCNDGWLLLEHGCDQGTAVRHMLATAGFSAIETLQDLGNRERVSLGRWRVDAGVDRHD